VVPILTNIIQVVMYIEVSVSVRRMEKTIRITI